MRNATCARLPLVDPGAPTSPEVVGDSLIMVARRSDRSRAPRSARGRGGRGGWSATEAVAASRLSISTCGTGGVTPGSIRARNASKPSSLPLSRPDPRSSIRRRSVAASDRTHTSRSVPPPSSRTQPAHRAGSRIWPVKRGREQHRGATGADLAGGGGHAAVLVDLDLRVVPVARSPGGRPAAASVAATKDPRRVSLSGIAGTREPGEQQVGDRALARTGRAGDDPGVRDHLPSVGRAGFPTAGTR